MTATQITPPEPLIDNDPAEQAVRKFAGAVDQPEVTDRESPDRSPILALGSTATPALLRALANSNPAYVEHRTDFVYLLGEIGDPRAYPELARMYGSEQNPAARERIGISLGASLNDMNARDFIERIARENTPESWALLRRISGQTFENRTDDWLNYLLKPENLAEVRRRCIQLSKPELG